MEKKKIVDCIGLWKQCFSDSEEYMNYYFTEKVKDNHILTLYEGEKITSMIHLNPYEINLCGTQVKVNYIVGVATDVEYRKQGRMRILLVQALKKMYEEEQGFTYLMPADEKIYTPFDFRFIYEQERLVLHGVKSRESIFQLHAAQIDSDLQVYSQEKVNEQSVSELVTFVNDKLNNDFDMYTLRSKEYYIRLQNEMKAAGGEIVVFYRRNKVIGVVAYMMDGRKAEIVEAILEKQDSQEIMDSLFLRIAEGQEEQIDIDFMETYYIDPEALGKKYAIIKQEQKKIIMARIVNLKEFAKVLGTQESFTRIIEVEDSILTDNNGVWKFSFSPNGCDTSKTKELPECTMTIYEVLKCFLEDKKIYINEIV